MGMACCNTTLKLATGIQILILVPGCLIFSYMATKLDYFKSLSIPEVKPDIIITLIAVGFGLLAILSSLCSICMMFSKSWFTLVFSLLISSLAILSHGFASILLMFPDKFSDYPKNMCKFINTKDCPTMKASDKDKLAWV